MLFECRSLWLYFSAKSYFTFWREEDLCKGFISPLPFVREANHLHTDGNQMSASAKWQKKKLIFLITLSIIKYKNKKWEEFKFFHLPRSWWFMTNALVLGFPWHGKCNVKKRSRAWLLDIMSRKPKHNSEINHVSWKCTAVPLSPGSQFAGKARLFIWLSVNNKYTTRALVHSRRHAELELWEQRASTFEITVPRACSALPCITWANTPFLLCAFLCPFRIGVSGLAALLVTSWTQQEQMQVSLFHVNQSLSLLSCLDFTWLQICYSLLQSLHTQHLAEHCGPPLRVLPVPHLCCLSLCLL